jgi:hypothetical protein
MVKNEKTLSPELIELLSDYVYYPESQNPRLIFTALQNLEKIYENIHPLLLRAFNIEKNTVEQILEPVPKFLEEGLFALGQVFDVKLIRLPLLNGEYIEPIYTFTLLGKPTHIKIFNMIWKGMLNLYEVYLGAFKKRLLDYNRYIKYHKRKSPWLVKHETLDVRKIKSNRGTRLRLKIIYYFNKWIKLRYALDAQFVKSIPYLRFKKEINQSIVKILGPKWKDRIKETKTTKYYFGLKPFKVQNRWINSKILPGYLKRTEELRHAIKASKIIQIPKNLPPMPRHSRKVKGAAARWKPKSYR